MMKKIKLIIFDMDGVLVDVSRSYNLAIKKTSEFFLGRSIDYGAVKKIKMKPGFNDDYDAVNGILRENNLIVNMSSIIKKFQEYYLGRKFNGLINDEKLLLKKDIIDKLAKKYKLAIFTGRPKKEADFPLKKFGLEEYFEIVVAAEDVRNKKPNPEGIFKILKKIKIGNDGCVYAGDSVDDLSAGKAAKIKFIGVIPPYADKKDLRKILKGNGAEVIIDNINSIPKVL